MRTSPEFIMENEKPPGIRPPFGKFACYARGMPRAMSIQVPFGALDERPLMSDHDYHRMRMFNRHKHMADPVPSKPQDGFDGTTIDGEADEISLNQRGLPGPRGRKPSAQKPDDDPTTAAPDF
jgi:hypothetical protein